MEPRKVIGSVDTSEFLVALAASLGFLVALGSEAISLRIVGALLIGGLFAAPLAAWLVQKVTARLLGAAVGGLIVITNVRTVFSVLGEGVEVRAATYAVLSLVWVLAVGYVVREHRKHGLPLVNGNAAREPRAVPATESAR
jgi:hypothetical protein